MASGSENRMVNGWITLPNSRISTVSTSIRPMHHRVAEALRSVPAWISASPDSGDARPVGGSSTLSTISLNRAVAGAERHAHGQVGPDGHHALAVQAVRRCWAPRRLRCRPPHAAAPLRRTPSAPSAPRSGPGRRVTPRVKLHPHRDQPVVDRHLGQRRVDVADGGHPHRPSAICGRGDAQPRGLFLPRA